MNDKKCKVTCSSTIDCSLSVLIIDDFVMSAYEIKKNLTLWYLRNACMYMWTARAISRKKFKDLSARAAGSFQ